MAGQKQTEFYRLSIEDTERTLETSQKTGLSDQEIAKRQQQYGLNSIETTKNVSKLGLFFSQFKDVLIIVLIIAATVSLVLNFVEPSTNFSAIKDAIGCNRSTLDARETDRFCSDPASICKTNYAQEGDVKELCAANHQEGPTEALLIYAIVIAIALVGFLNEYKAEKTVEALRKLVGYKAKVLRGDEKLEVASDQLVPGDIIFLAEGDKVPADIRLTNANSLKINESSLTGESLPISKTTNIIAAKSSLGDQKNMVFSGTIVMAGSATGVVIGTGRDSEIGRIAGLVESVEEEKTPMQKKLDNLGRQIGAGVLIICLLVFVIIFFLDKNLIHTELLQRLILAFTAAVALAVAAIPEGLAFVVRISLALGARRMASKNALVRKLSAVEALGSTDVVCSDKTGTLTRGQMTVRKLWTADGESELSGRGYDIDGELSNKNTDFSQLLKIGLLCNDAKLDSKGIIGDPTEASLLVSAGKVGLEANSQRIDEMPFTSERKMMSTAHKDGKNYFVATKGAAEQVLKASTHILRNGKVVKLTAKDRNQILETNKSLAGEALRVLGFAYKTSSTKPNHDMLEKDLVFVGLQGMMDPPRKEVVEVVSRVQAEAGMRVIMITGDFIETARAVAAEIGIEGEALSGIDIEELSDEQLCKKVEDVSVYARVNPDHKIRIVKALKKNGHQVAMTGDGVNDSPAIKAADIGIAMGITGSDATKEAADLILLDDQFLTIIAAIEEGRGIFDNVRKFVNNLLSTNIAEVITIFVGVLIFQDLLLTATQLLFINIVTDGLPSIALGSDPAEKGIMRYKPWHFQGSIVNKRIWAEVAIFCSLMSIALVAMYGYLIDKDPIQAVSTVFVGMVIFEVVRLVDIRTDYDIAWFSNPWLTVSLIISAGMQMLLLYIKPLADIFGVEPISAGSWLAIAIISVLLFVTMKLLNPILDKWSPEIHS